MAPVNYPVLDALSSPFAHGNIIVHKPRAISSDSAFSLIRKIYPSASPCQLEFLPPPFCYTLFSNPNPTLIIHTSISIFNINSQNNVFRTIQFFLYPSLILCIPFISIILDNQELFPECSYQK